MNDLNNKIFSFMFPIVLYELIFNFLESRRDDKIFKWIKTSISHDYSAFNFLLNVICRPICYHSFSNIWTFPHFQRIDFQLAYNIFHNIMKYFKNSYKQTIQWIIIILMLIEPETLQVFFIHHKCSMCPPWLIWQTPNPLSNSFHTCCCWVLRHFLTSWVISVVSDIKHEKSDKFCSEALILARGSFTCRNSATRDPQLYFPSEGSHTQDFKLWKKSIDPGQVRTCKPWIQRGVW